MAFNILQIYVVRTQNVGNYHKKSLLHVFYTYFDANILIKNTEHPNM